MAGTTGNVYGLIEREPYRITFAVGRERDAIFERLAAEADLHRCGECNEWKDGSEMDPDVPGLCTPCVDAQNGDDLSDLE